MSKKALKGIDEAWMALLDANKVALEAVKDHFLKKSENLSEDDPDPVVEFAPQGYWNKRLENENVVAADLLQALKEQSFPVCFFDDDIAVPGYISAIRYEVGYRGEGAIIVTVHDAATKEIVELEADGLVRADGLIRFVNKFDNAGIE